MFLNRRWVVYFKGTEASYQAEETLQHMALSLLQKFPPASRFKILSALTLI